MKIFKPVLFFGFFTAILMGCSAEEEPVEGNDAANEGETEESADDSADEADEKTNGESDVDYPMETIEVVVPAGPGGDTDMNSRNISEHLQEELGEDIIVRNVEGGGGTTGSSEILNAEPDGHQVLFFHNGMLVNEILGLADYGFRDFELAGIPVMDEGNGFFVSGDSQFDDAEDFIQHGQEYPREASVATEVGSFTHVQLLAIEDETGADFNIVDVGGASDKIAALLGGQIDVAPFQYGSAVEYIESGDFKTLGILAEDSVDLMPDVPTFTEQGVDASFEKFFFFGFPPETPDEIVTTFSEAVETVVEENEEYQQASEDFYVSPDFHDPDETYDVMSEAYDYYEQLLEGVEADQ
ncbi:tripartite-type tricarboxylate transporter receptor subunit TctC [Geomicrobium halophilum]|uniref:Tripartite-type tricarboxylate transporter receptor subunit TctC n=1 Tax=Geomicrobium halophilum TaxID=549000 RepID=A0A841PQV0_9BACL|nr:tripartite tricarboxylate transporter substrate binding protein [Geomicrobium halophilum]MBB6448671.1 tripartite-type tricarboxylate transporter receptor subunit TctC [Geomicrobium halophilum]